MEGQGYSSGVKQLFSICEALGSTSLWNFHLCPNPLKERTVLILYCEMAYWEKTFICCQTWLLCLWKLCSLLLVFVFHTDEIIVISWYLDSWFKIPLRFIHAVMWIRCRSHFIVETYTYLRFHTLVVIRVSRFWPLK